MRQCLIVIALLVAATTSHAQTVWPKGKSSAIVLTYDDALPSQLDIAIPQLDAARFKGTFFLSGRLTPSALSRWQKAQRKGHELGNHSVNHPCPRAMLPDRPDHHADDYSVERMLDEIASMNLALSAVDGRDSRTYSVPCSQMFVGGEDYTDALRRSKLVKYARTGGDAWKSVVIDATKLDVFQVPSYGPVDKPGADELIAYVERVRTARGLGVLQFHGVGSDYLEVTAEAHAALLKHLRKSSDIWVGTFQDVMDYVTSHSR
ncbi:MAG: polysaccharide deacetylase family protein [Steroidobacteraceae bacterium]|nr:polysaccharide deacetylase family protein [Steroidobacteraceae bacterium]